MVGVKTVSSYGCVDWDNISTDNTDKANGSGSAKAKRATEDLKTPSLKRLKP
jgi:autotransporter adhesin